MLNNNQGSFEAIFVCGQQSVFRAKRSLHSKPELW